MLGLRSARTTSTQRGGGRGKPLGEMRLNSFHCRSDRIRGSAVQFNSSVSAMPLNAWGKSAAPSGQGTADYTLLVCWAA